MMRITRMIVTTLMVLALASVAFADTVEIKQKDGSRWRGKLNDTVEVTFTQQGVEVPFKGTLKQVESLFIVIEGDEAGSNLKKTIFKGDIVKMRSLEGEEAEGVTRRPPGSGMDATASRIGRRDARPDPSKQGVIVLPLEGMVGLEFRHDEIKAVGEEADKLGPGQIIVLEIHSGGGSMLEMEKIHMAMEDLKKRHRVVAWIKEAISAACATAIHCDEIYFVTSGTAGSMTGFNSGTGESLQGHELATWLSEASKWMESGGRFGHIAKVMIDEQFELSYDKDEETGEVIFHPDLSGEHVLSRKGENLTFNSGNAHHCGFADGVADTYDELAELLDLDDWHEVSDAGREAHERWTGLCERGGREIPKLLAELTYKGSGGGQISQLGAQLSIVKKLIRWRHIAPNVCDMNGVPPIDFLERWKEDLQRALAELRRG